MRMLLRLDGNPRAQMARQASAPQADFSKTDRLGNVEEAVISKYGGGEGGSDDEEGSDEDEGSDEE